MKPAGRNSRADIDDCGVLVSVLGVPTAGDEIDLVHDRGLEQFVEAARYSRRHGYAIDVIRILGVLAADVDLAGWSASRTSDGLLQDLRSGVGRTSVILVLLEALVARPGIDCEWHRSVDGYALQTYGNWGECEVDAEVTTCIADGDLFGNRPETQEARGYRVSPGRNVVSGVTAKCVG